MAFVAPNRPMEMAQEARTGFTCYTAPGVTFANEEEMKEHYRSEWHRQNLKRKVAGLGPLSRDAFEERQAREAATPTAATVDAPIGASRSTIRRLKREARHREKVEKTMANPNSKAAHYEATRKMTEEEYVEHKMGTAEPYDEGSDLFSRHHSASLSENLAYMARTHGFYIPYMDYVTDLPGLMNYLLEMVYVGNVALVTGKQFHTLEAVQAHMRDKGGCRMELEGHEEEYEPYYAMEALAEKSPLWEWVVEEEEGEEGDEEGWETDEEGGDGDGDGDAAMQEGTTAEGDEDDDPLASLFEQCVRLSLISEAQVDALTDAVASGEATEAALLEEWGTRLSNARANAKKAPKARSAAQTAVVSVDDDASMAGSSRAPATVMRVRYRPVGGDAASEAGSLHFKRAGPHGSQVEVGHRSMRIYYNQSYRPNHGSPLGHLGGSPELQKLMLQYSKAGVLTNPSSGNRHLAGIGARSEIGYREEFFIKKKFVAQGINNNKTMGGMKHFKNQSLMY